MMETGFQTDAILMDLTKAFDKVPHQHLLRKLEYYSITGHKHRWIQAFLSQRKQRVVLDSETGQYLHVLSGVHQGDSHWFKIEKSVPLAKIIALYHVIFSQD